MSKEISKLKCPVCGNNSLRVVLVENEIPYFGKVVISSSVCEICGYKLNDVFSVETREPLEYKLFVENEEDLMIRVVKSSSATIVIPDLGLKIEPGPLSQGYVSNVEGVLRRIEDVFRGQVTVLEGKKKEKMKTLLKKLEKMIAGKEKFVLIIKDPLGNSAIISQKVKKRKLTKKEIENLKTGYLVLDISQNRK